MRVEKCSSMHCCIIARLHASLHLLQDAGHSKIDSQQSTSPVSGHLLLTVRQPLAPSIPSCINAKLPSSVYVNVCIDYPLHRLHPRRRNTSFASRRRHRSGCGTWQFLPRPRSIWCDLSCRCNHGLLARAAMAMCHRPARCCHHAAAPRRQSRTRGCFALPLDTF
jgi:hypothetical protein